MRFCGRRIKKKRPKKSLPIHQNTGEELPAETKEHKKCRTSSLEWSERHLTDIGETMHRISTTMRII